MNGGFITVSVCLSWVCGDHWHIILEDNPSSCAELGVLPTCSCHTTKSSEIDMSHIEIQQVNDMDLNSIIRIYKQSMKWRVCSNDLQVLGQGHFATVFQGRHKGSAVAVKVLPAAWKHKFNTEKEVYELPLMRHAGIVHFLGSGRRPDDSSWFIVLQFAEYVEWKSSLLKTNKYASLFFYYYSNANWMSFWFQGSLHSFLCKHTISWMLSLKMCQTLSQGLSYLHSDLLSSGTVCTYEAFIMESMVQMCICASTELYTITLWLFFYV